MHEPEYGDLPEEVKRPFSDLFDQEVKTLEDLRKEYGDDHPMRIFRPKKKDYLKQPK